MAAPMVVRPSPGISASSFGATIASNPYSCPKCSSPDAKKLSIIWREGLSSIDTTTRASGATMGCIPLMLAPFTLGLSLLVAGGLVIGRGKTKGRQQNLASLGASPPEERSYLPALMVLLLGSLFTAVMMEQNPTTAALLQFLVFGAAVFTALRIRSYNRSDVPRLRREWERSFRCSRCEHIYVVADE